MGVTYDTGALIAAERDDRAMWTMHRRMLKDSVIPWVDAPVLAQAWRGGSRQVLLARLLGACRVQSFDEQAAREVGLLLGRSGTADIVDAGVVTAASRRGNVVVTSDPNDLARLADVLGVRLRIQVV